MEAGEGDYGAHDLACAEDIEGPGCPWDRNAVRYADDGIRGDHSPSMEPLEPAPLERCPDSAVMGEMSEVPAGAFVMGCELSEDAACGKAERGARALELPAFAIDRTEVTQAAYQRCIDAGSCTAPAGGFEPRAHCTHPVVNVSWAQAGEYCESLGRRLPTEREWEKAARGTQGPTFPWGDASPSCERANFGDCGLRAARPVASYPAGASPYGVLDMAGNVREWVFDSEPGRGRQPKRGIRGGMFTDRAQNLRAARRSWGDVSVSDLGIGFRCAS